RYWPCGCAAVGMVIFQSGLRLCRVPIGGPVSNIPASFFFIGAGPCFFDERLPADPVKLTMRVAGIVLAGAVVVVLSRRPPRAESRRIVAADAEAEATAPMIGAA